MVFRKCTIRGLLYVGLARGSSMSAASRRCVEFRAAPGRGSWLTLAQFKTMAREQFLLLLLEPEATLAAIPKLLPTDLGERRKGLAAIRSVLSASGEISGEAAERLKKVAELFETSDAGFPAIERAKAS